MIGIEQRGNLTVVKFTQADLGETAPVVRIEAHLDAAIACPNTNQVAIDLSKVSHIGSPFMNMLRSFQRRATAYGMKVSLVGVCKDVVASLKNVGLCDRLDLATTAA